MVLEAFKEVMETKTGINIDEYDGLMSSIDTLCMNDRDNEAIKTVLVILCTTLKIAEEETNRLWAEINELKAKIKEE